MTLREEIRRLAEQMAGEITAGNEIAPVANGIESAILEGVKVVLERPVSGAIAGAMFNTRVMLSMADVEVLYRAMTQELLKELNG